MIIQKSIYSNILFSTLFFIAGCGGKIALLDITQRDFEVAKVIDGNTISITRVILISDKDSKYYINNVEYIGVDSLNKNEPFYKSAKECNTYLLRKGHVKIEFDQQILDSSGKKLLAYVYVDDVFVNAEIIKRGYARADISEPNIKYAKLFSQLEKEARENRRGMWSYEPNPDVVISSEKGYVASRSGKSFHRYSCPFVSRIDESNKIHFESFKEALDSGRQPCKICKPSVNEEIPPLPKPPSSGEEYEVVHIVDGDTIDLMMNGKKVRVRLIGVDTPETVKPNTPVEFYGKEASLFTSNLLKGKSVYIEREPGMTTDKYDRSLFYIYRAPDGLFVNLEIIRQGYGHVYTVYPFQYMDQFRWHCKE